MAFYDEHCDRGHVLFLKIRRPGRPAREYAARSPVPAKLSLRTTSVRPNFPPPNLFLLCNLKNLYGISFKILPYALFVLLFYNYILV